ncbi:MAG: hypothetical protein JKY15_08420 [Deltaproteobacteria bacterium]|nr:hypothetical protein [Deltaproteobacteria bacterium]
MHEELILSPSEEELARSHFRGLSPGQIDYPLGPIDERLPFPIYFRFVLNQRQIVKTHLEIGWLHQGIEKLLEQAEPEEGCQIIRRVNPLCPNTLEHHYRLAIGMEPISEDVLRQEKRDYYLYFIRQILEHLEEDFLLRLLDVDLERFVSRFKNSKRVHRRLSGLGKISLEMAVSYGLSGPTLKACENGQNGNVCARLCAKLEEALNTSVDSHPEGALIISHHPGRLRIRTPSFVHAAALPVFLRGQQIDDVKLIMLSLGLVGSEIDR